MVGWHLVNEVPQLHVGLLSISRVLVGDGPLQSELLKELRLGVGKVSDFLNFLFFNWLIALE